MNANCTDFYSLSYPRVVDLLVFEFVAVAVVAVVELIVAAPVLVAELMFGTFAVVEVVAD